MKHYGADRPIATLILAHGAGAGETHPFMARISTNLAARGVETFTFNFPYIERKRSVPDPAPVLEASYLDTIRTVRGLAGPRRLFIGGKSMGGRIATQVAAAEGFEGVAGIVVLGYPLHPPGRPDVLRVKHLSAIRVPMLIVQGTRDAFGFPGELRPFFASHGSRIVIHPIENGDHSFVVPRRAGRPQADVQTEIENTIVDWMQS